MRPTPTPGRRTRALFWHRLVTLVWLPVQLTVIYGMIWWVTRTDHLSAWEIVVIFFGVGLISGAIGINYSHELMHQKNRVERWLADLLLASVLYSHFRTEHLLVHHRYVGTPRDTVTARYNEGFHRFFWRVLTDGPDRPGAPNARCWRGPGALLAPVEPVLALWRTAAYGTCLAFLMSAAGSASRCSSGRRWWRSGSWNWSTTSNITA